MLDIVIYYVKYVLLYIIISIRPYLSKKSTQGFGEKQPFTETEKESVRNQSDGFSIDASYFNGFDFHGNYFGFGMQRRPDRRCESVFFIRLIEFSNEPLVLSINPSTWTRHSPNEWQTDSGLIFKMKQPMKRWSIEFNGTVVEYTSRKPHQLKLELEWRGFPAIYDSDSDMSKHVIASSIASEKWSRTFFDNLKKLHQTHYEIFGETVACNISIDDTFNLTGNKFTSMKDRSYGLTRNWGDFRRYILHYLITENNIAIGCHFVSINGTFSHLLVGFVINRNKSDKLSPVKYCNKSLKNMGENQLLVNNKQEYDFDIITESGEMYNISLKVEKYVKFYCGENKDGTLYSAFVRGDVNGIPTVGMCEYEYNTIEFDNMII